MKDKNKDKPMAKKIADAVVAAMAAAETECPPCLPEQIAVDAQTIIRDTFLQSYQDAESVLGELQLQLDDCLNSGGGSAP